MRPIYLTNNLCFRVLARRIVLVLDSLFCYKGLHKLCKVHGPYASAGSDIQNTLRLDKGGAVQCSPKNKLEYVMKLRD